MTATTATTTTRDGLQLHTCHWECRDPWATVLVVHGLGEHAGRYDHVGDHFVAAGLDVHAYDQRGFGRSEGRRAYVDQFSQFLDDLEDRIAAVRAEVPLILLGHSMGGLVATAYATRARPPVDVLVLSAPALGSDSPAWQRGVSKVLHRVAPKLSVPGKIDPTVLSHDVAVQQGYANDPLVEKDATVNLAHELFSAMGSVTAAVEKLTVPTLVVHGTADQLVPAKYSAILGSVPGVKRVLYPDLRHELFNEPESPQILDDVVHWMRSTIDATADAK